MDGTGRPVRVGDTIRRPAYPRSAYVDAFLRHLAEIGFAGAPRPLGYDEHGRQILTFVEGEVLDDAGPYRLSDARILSATELIRSFHDASTSGQPGPGDEVICHSDLGPHNTVFRGERAVALIDFDGDLGPGRRVDDFDQAVWGFADLTEPEVAVAEQARKTTLMCAAYGHGMTPAVVVAALTTRFGRARAQHAAAGLPGAVEVFDGLLAWMARFGSRIAAG